MGLFSLGSAKESSSVIENCHVRSEVPGKEIIKTIGLVQYTKKGIAGDVTGEISGVFQSLLKAATEKGANAVVNVRFETGSYHKQGSQWEVTYVTAFGEGVVLE